MSKIYLKHFCLTAIFISLSINASASLLVSSSQSVNVSGKYLPDNPANVPDPRLDLSASYSGNNTGGTSDFDFDLSDKGIDSGRAYWDIGISQSSLRSVSDLRIQHDFSSQAQFTDLSVNVSSNVSYADTITVRDLSTGQLATPTNLFVRFEVGITGELYNDVIYDNPSIGGASVANYSSEANFSSRIANSSGDANEDWQIASTNSEHSNGIFGSNVLEREFINSNVTFQDLLWNGQAIFFGWDFTEMFEVEIEGIDVGSIDINLQNDLGNTFVTRASVFDADGNWLSNYAVESSEGFNYEQISSLANTPLPVPAPSSALSFFALALFGSQMLRKKRKATLHN
jgi:hypothetical protein